MSTGGVRSYSQSRSHKHHPLLVIWTPSTSSATRAAAAGLGNTTAKPRAAPCSCDAGDHRRRARAQWETWTPGGGYGDDDRSGQDCSRSPQKRPRGSSDLPEYVHFVSAGTIDPSRGPDRSRNTRSSDPGPKATSASEPATVAGSLESNKKVEHMMCLMNYEKGTALGKHGQGLIAPIEAILRPKNAGLGTCEGSFNTGGEDLPPPNADNWPKWGDARGAKKHGRDFTGPKWNDAGGSLILATLRDKSASEAAARAQKMLHLAGWTSRLLRDDGALDDGKEMADALPAITKAMALVHEESALGKLTMGELILYFIRLKKKFPEEYKTYCLADTAGELAAPLLRPVFQLWEPLSDPSSGLDVVQLLKNILEDASAMSPYAVLVNDIVVPAVLASTWEARDHDPMVRFMKTWEDTLPPSAVQCILEKVVMPKLAAAVETWEPRWETVPCHVWVCPWIPYLGHLLENLYGAIRRKLEGALWKWSMSHAADDYDMVSPWKEVFEPASWEELVERHVMPYLRQGLRELQVTPPRQKDSTFGQVMKWAPLVPARDMVPLLEAEFFGKWRDALHRWLRAARPKEGEAVAWYEGWKRLFTPELLADERVRVPLEAFRDTINRAAQGVEIDRPGPRQHAIAESHAHIHRSRWSAPYR